MPFTPEDGSLCRVNTNIINDNNNINNSNNFQSNPFNSCNNAFNNLYNNQNLKTYNFKGISVTLPTSDTFGKVPPNAFGNNNYRMAKEYEDKNKMKGLEYNTARMETIIVDDNFKNCEKFL